MSDLQKNIKSLVINYHAFQQAVANNDYDGASIWARGVRRAQKALGFEIIPDERLRYWLHPLYKDEEVDATLRYLSEGNQ